MPARSVLSLMLRRNNPPLPPLSRGQRKGKEGNMAEKTNVEKAFDLQSQAEVTVIRGKDANIAEIDFTENIDELNDAFEREERVIQFKMGEDKVINIAVRGLTSIERIQVSGNFFGNALNEALREFGDMSDEEALAKAQAKLRENVSAEELQTQNVDIKYKTVLAGITRPSGITREVLDGWDEFYIDTLYEAIEELSRTPDNFREVDTEPGE